MNFPQLGNKTVGWVPEPPHDRGTASLLYNNLLTLFLCSWSAVHLNVAADGDSSIIIKLRKIKWMIVTILAPEFVATYAFRDWCYARTLRKELNDWYGRQKDEYHAYCRSVGIHRYWPKIDAPWTMTHAFFVGMGGLAAELPQGPRVRLLTEIFRGLMTGGMRLPFISEEEIQDKSKASWLVKAVAYIQIAWFVIQTAARFNQGLPVSPLELFSLAIVICTLVSYILWWNKPLDVERPMVIKLYGRRIDVLPRNYPFLVDDDEIRESQREIDVETIGTYDVRHMQGIDDLASMRQRNSHLFTMYHEDRAWFMIVISLVFGACHLVAWNWPFPSNFEKWAWRLASLGCVLSPILFALVHVIAQAFRKLNERRGESETGLGITRTDEPIKGLDYFIIPFYVLCRLYLAIEIFISIRSMPPSVYVSVIWLHYIPHF